MVVKKCFKCLIKKPLKDFYKHPQMADGHLNKCKECTKKDTLETRSANPEYYKQYDRERAGKPHRVKLRKEIAKKWKESPKLRKRMCELKKAWQEKNTIKRAAHIIAGGAIKSGKLIKQPCEVCGNLQIDAHHDDYTKPLDVRWLCKKHHAEHHKNERDKNRNKN